MRFAKLAMLWLCIIPLWALDTLVSTETKVQGYSQHRSADSDTLFSGQYLSAQNLSQQLAFLGFETKQEGGVGHFEPYSYRGFDSPHIPVTINGFDLSSIDGQVANLSKISLLWADTIILNKGSESQSHFASIDIRIPKEGTFISTSTSIPLANEFHLGINNHYQNFNFNHLISTQFYPNRFKYLDRNRTPYNTKDDKLRILDNGEYHAFNSFHQMTYTHENSFEWQTSVFLNSEGGGLHGREGLAADSAGYFQFKLGIQNSFNFKKHNYSNFNNWSNQGSYWSGDDHFYYQSKEATLLEQKLFSTKNTYTYKFLNYKIFNSKILMSSNLSYRFPLENSNPKFNWNWHGYKHNSLLSLFNTIQLNDNRFEYSIHLNMVYEKFKLSEKSFSNSDNDTYLFYNIKYHHNYNDHLNISINTNKFLREPELVQKYGGSTGILPSQDLIAETGYSHEISIQNNFKYFSQGIKTYLNQIEDKITPIKSV